MSMKIHHIGYLVKNINESLKDFCKLGFVQETEIVYDEIREVQIVFLNKENYRIELVAPKAKTSDIGNLHKKIGNSPYHICYEVNDLKQAIESLERDGYLVTITPEIAPAIKNCKVAFLFNINIGMVELVEVIRNERENF